MPVLSFRVLVLLWSALANALLAALVWWRYRRQRLLRLFAFSVAGVAGYSLFVAGLAGLETQEQAVAWVRGATLLPYLALISFFNFSVVLGRAKGVWPRRILVLGWTAAVLDSLLRLSGIAYVSLIRLPTQGWFPGPDVVYFFVYLPALLCLVPGGLYLLWRRRRTAASAREEVQLTYVFLAMGLGLSFSLLDLVEGWEPLAAVGPVAYTSVLAFAILRRRLLDIRLLLQRGAIGAALSVSLGAAAVLAILLGRLAWPHSPYGDVFAAFLAAAVFSLTYQPLRRRIQAWAERLGSAQAWDSSSRLLEFSLLSSTHPRWEEQIEATVQKLVEDFQLENAILILPDQRGLLLKVAQAPSDALRKVDAPSPELLKRLNDAPLGLDMDDLAWASQYEDDEALLAAQDPSDADARAFMALNHARASFALRGSQKAQGVLLVGAPRSGRTFSDQDAGFFTALAAQLGRAVENQQLHGQVQQADRLSSLGTLAASLTHEIRNPLTSISLFLAMLPKRHREPEFIERFTRVVGLELEKLSQLSDQMLSYAKPAGARKLSIDMGPLAERTRQLMAYHFAKRKVRVSLHAAEGVWVRGVESEISQVLVNLLLNALDASEPEKEVAVIIARDGEEAVMAVRDQGKGISPDQQALLFEPFFTTKEHGTGLGLPTCQRIVEGAGGSILVHSRLGEGTTFEVRLPLVEAPPDPLAPKDVA